MVVSQVHNRYYSKNTRGYYIIRKFYSKYKRQLEEVRHYQLNDILHRIYLNLHKIEKSNIVKHDINYTLSAIHVQCRALLSESEMLDEQKGTAEKTSAAAENGKSNGMSDLLSFAGDESFQKFLYQLSLFRLTINDREIQILNALIDGKSIREIAEELGLTEETLKPVITKLKSELVNSLKNTGVPSDLVEVIFKESANN
jgi:ATP/maltotriose-dependent transcriptional regulator MalT